VGTPCRLGQDQAYQRFDASQDFNYSVLDHSALKDGGFNDSGLGDGGLNCCGAAGSGCSVQPVPAGRG
jgi:hypothetical protein